MASMITTFNIAVTETVGEILGKYHEKKTPWVSANIVDLCNKRRELKKKTFEPEGSEKYREVHKSVMPYYPRSPGKMPYGRTGYTEPMDKIVL